MADSREVERRQWLDQQLGDYQISLLAGDASFRRYFRVMHEGATYVLMDAPPAHEDVKPFLAVRDWFDAAGLRVSTVKAADIDAGFLLLEDFGDETWASFRQGGGDMAPLFEDALAQLLKLQTSNPGFDLPRFDLARMHRECDLYLDWYLPRVAGYEPDQAEREQFHAALEPLLLQIDAMPKVPVHLDYHSRNLMLPPDGLPLGQIDYQDAVNGPLSYDLASLLYDCYQEYPEAERREWSAAFYARLDHHHTSAFADFEAWHRLLRLTALQRHIKAIGIFARLAYRDGKQQFLNEISLTRKHLMEELALFAPDEPALRLLSLAPAPPCN